MMTLREIRDLLNDVLVLDEREQLDSDLLRKYVVTAINELRNFEEDLEKLPSNIDRQRGV